MNRSRVTLSAFASLLLPATALVAFVACGELAGLGDSPGGASDAGPNDGALPDVQPLPSVDAGTDAGSDTADAADAADTADTTDSADAAPPTSCLDVLKRSPAAPSGIYAIIVGDAPINAYCDMELAGGGWTAFFAATLGVRNVFAHFDRGGSAGDSPDDCADPSAQCLRHLPASVTLANGFAAACGTNAVGFTATPEILAYFRDGTSHDWLPVGAPTPLTPSAHAEYATNLWSGGRLPDAGSDTNFGWILSNAVGNGGDSDQHHTFASSYDSRSKNWDYCDGTDYNVPDSGTPFDAGTPVPRVRLFYR